MKINYATLDKLLDSLRKETKDRIKKVIEDRKKIDNISPSEMLSFVSRIAASEDRAIELGIDYYYGSGSISNPDRTLGYLAAIIASGDYKLEKRREVEKQIYGIPPQKVEYEGN